MVCLHNETQHLFFHALDLALNALTGHKQIMVLTDISLLSVKQERLTFLPEYHPFVHDEVEDTGEDEGNEVAKDDIESGKMADENEGDHLDEEGCYAGNIIGKEATQKSSHRTLAHTVLPHKEIGKGVVGKHSTFK